MAEKLIWRGRGALGHGKNAVYPDQEIPDAIAKQIESDRIAKLKKLGKIQATTSTEDQAAIRKAAEKAQAAKAKKEQADK
jgi:hypothetical protein